MWWDTPRIEATVTRQFVCSHLYAEEVGALDRPLAFGGGLTDGTYWEWIDEKAKRLFLILVDLGCPNQIFGLIDDSWEDDDLPIAIDQIGRLPWTGTRDERFDRKFYTHQYQYLVRYLEPGSNIVYQEDDIIPLDVVDRRPGLTSNNAVDRVELPNRPGEIFSRRRIPLGTGPGLFSYEEFLYEVNLTKNIQNDHLVSYYGSYTHHGFGYVLFTPASDFNLKSLLVTLPAPVKSLDKQVRRNLVMNWIHCLCDTLCYIHSRGNSHGNIKPSSILFNSKNNVFYTDLTRLSGESLALASDKSAFDKESYDYAAPEQWYRPTTTSASSHRANLLSPTLSSPTLPPESARFSISRGHGGEGNTSPRTPHTPYTPHAPHSPPTTTTTPHLDAQAADVFSLGCVILELLSFQLKRATKSFAAHRAAKHKTPGRGGAVPDSSFHKNVGQVESWMAGLAKDAAKKRDGSGADRAVFRGVAPTLQVVARMLSVAPADRPTAREVERHMYRVLTEYCGIREPHCVHQYGDGGGSWGVGVGGGRGSGSGGSGHVIDEDEDEDDLGMGGLRIRDRDGNETYAVSVAPTTRSFARSEPRMTIRDSDRETMASYGGRSDPGSHAASPPQATWQHPGGHRGFMLSSQSGAM
ncbi:hypothetical protein SLS62_006995 [Diatrype stigma]|uniref:Protein kinase domain-containing protein n=1 Tax=Diatrype stigma TaxID=117547 RepID=A0AAN9YR44_9PEZI